LLLVLQELEMREDPRLPRTEDQSSEQDPPIAAFIQVAHQVNTLNQFRNLMTALNFYKEEALLVNSNNELAITLKDITQT
jgi:hypothetical protein